MCSTEPSKQTCYSSVILWSSTMVGETTHIHSLDIPTWRLLFLALQCCIHPLIKTQAKWENEMTSRCTVYLQRKHVFSCTPKWSYGLYVHTNERNGFLPFYVPQPFVFSHQKEYSNDFTCRNLKERSEGKQIFLKEHNPTKNLNAV